MLIFELAAQHVQWIAARQAVASSNIANSNTPGYRAAHVAPFDEVLDQGDLASGANGHSHLHLGTSHLRFLSAGGANSWDTSLSGNDVTLESELLKIGENGRMMAMDTNIMRAFQRFLLTSLKVST